MERVRPWAGPPEWLRGSLAALLAGPQNRDDQALAARYAPVIYFDAREPFLPCAAGYSIFRAPEPSRSFRRDVDLGLPGGGRAALAIEYAIWWDWDIGHLYELEHCWVYVDDAGRVVRAEASWHGDLHDMAVSGVLRTEGDHVALYSQPGKHAFAPCPGWFDEIRLSGRPSSTRDRAGVDGVLVNDLFRGRIRRTPQADTVARTYLRHFAFDPEWSFSRRYALAQEDLVPWEALSGWIPGRVNQWIDTLMDGTPPEDYAFLRIGHRGASGHAPDNTLTGLRTAAKLGADACEIDIQRTADGRCAVIHDAFLRSPDGRVLPVQRSTLDELRRVPLAGGERVPTLEEMLELAGDLRLGLYIEVKDGGAVPLLIDALHDAKATRRVMVGSFRPDWVAEVGALEPELRTAVLFGSAHMDAVALARSAGASYVHPCWDVSGADPERMLTAAWVRAAREAGLGIILWHEERPEVIAYLRTLGVDGICSDLPERLLAGQPATNNRLGSSDRQKGSVT